LCVLIIHQLPLESEVRTRKGGEGRRKDCNERKGTIHSSGARGAKGAARSERRERRESSKRHESVETIKIYDLNSYRNLTEREENGAGKNEKKSRGKKKEDHKSSHVNMYSCILHPRAYIFESHIIENHIARERKKGETGKRKQRQLGSRKVNILRHVC